MDKLLLIFGDIHHTKLGGGDSFSDQLNCKYTVYILCLIAVLSTTRVFVDEPISCYCPSQFTGSQVDFTKKICWTTNTHWVPLNKANLPAEHDPDKYFISYYQWIPFFLACQAFLFYLPRPIWRLLSRKSGITISHVTDAGIECQRKSDHESIEKIMRYITNYLGRFLVEFNRNCRSSRRFNKLWLVWYGNYLVYAYLLTKLLYLANVVGQLFLLNRFLGTDYHFYGVDVLRRMAVGETWMTSHRFPRVTICDFYIRVLGNIHRHSVQCALPMNLFYEIIFIFLWFWFVFVAATTVGSFIFWATISSRFQPQERYIRHRLVAMGSAHSGQRSNLSKFVREHLRRDGCLIVRLVAKNSSDLIASELICGLWDHYLKHLKSPMAQDRERALVSGDDNPSSGIDSLGSGGYTSPAKSDKGFALGDIGTLKHTRFDAPPPKF